MKNFTVCFLIGLASCLPVQKEQASFLPRPLHPSENLVLVTIDGFRWQELFKGIDSALLYNGTYTRDPATLAGLYWSEDAEARRKKLMPFLWNVLAKEGQVFGNRDYGNDMNVSNLYAISYPGYNEIFTGKADLNISSNEKKYNPNRNILEYLAKQPGFEGKIAAFTSWDVFPYILNETRSDVPVNSGYESIGDAGTETEERLNQLQEQVIKEPGATRNDQLTFIAAREYMQRHQPRVLFIGFGQTDEFAHDGQYDLYIQQINEIDRMIGRLWHWIQSTDGYRDHTTLVITTDHGRGKKIKNWSRHGIFVNGSSETWLAWMGPGLQALGEVRDPGQFYQRQLAPALARMVGTAFDPMAGNQSGAGDPAGH